MPLPPRLKFAGKKKKSKKGGSGKKSKKSKRKDKKGGKKDALLDEYEVRSRRQKRLK